MGFLKDVLRMKKRGRESVITKYKPEEIKKKVADSINVMGKCETYDDIKNVFTNIVTAVGEGELAFELFSFIPEIYCRVLFPEVKYDDEIIFKIEDGKEYEMSSTGFIGYIQIQEAVFERIREKLDVDIHEKILIHSFCFNEINKGLTEGQELGDLKIGPITLITPKGYTPFKYEYDYDL